MNKFSDGFCVWFTGLSGSGKTTLAIAMEKKLLGLGFKVERLDGDTVRNGLCSDLGFSKKDRETNIERVMFVAKLLARNGVCVLASFISPYKRSREVGRKEINNFIEAYVKCPVEVCEKRDPKGLYKLARDGKINNFTGIDDPYEEPVSPDIILDTANKSIEVCVADLYFFLVHEGLY